MLEDRPGRRIVYTGDTSKVKAFDRSGGGGYICLGAASLLRGVGPFREGPEHDRGHAREATAGFRGVLQGIPPEDPP